MSKKPPIVVNPRGKAQDAWIPVEVDSSHQPVGHDRPSQVPVDIGGGTIAAPPQKPSETPATPPAQPTESKGKG